jgi:hypothetical protein
VEVAVLAVDVVVKGEAVVKEVTAIGVATGGVVVAIVAGGVVVVARKVPGLLSLSLVAS